VEKGTAALTNAARQATPLQGSPKIIVSPAIVELEADVSPPRETMVMPNARLGPIGLSMASRNEAVAELTVFGRGAREGGIEASQLIED
jgi:hypothetical protein